MDLDLIARAERELNSGTLPPDPMCLIRAQTVRDLIDTLLDAKAPVQSKPEVRMYDTWLDPELAPFDSENVQVLCRVLADAVANPMRSVHCAVSSGDHAEGDLFVSIGWRDENFEAESGWYVAGWDMAQDCWTEARRYEVVGWLPLASTEVGAEALPQSKPKNKALLKLMPEVLAALDQTRVNVSLAADLRCALYNEVTPEAPGAQSK